MFIITLENIDLFVVSYTKSSLQFSSNRKEALKLSKVELDSFKEVTKNLPFEYKVVSARKEN